MHKGIVNGAILAAGIAAILSSELRLGAMPSALRASEGILFYPFFLSMET